MRRRRLWLVGVVAALALVGAGCGGGDDEDEAAPAAETTTTVEETTTTGEETTTTAAAEGATIAVADSEEHGQILTDGEGRTLYLFTNDTKDAGTSVCTGDCLEAWPALPEATAGEGADASLISSIDRPDGSKQAAYNGWPLYYFANDRQPGDTNGQGLGDVWWVVSPEGEAIR